MKVDPEKSSCVKCNLQGEWSSRYLACGATSRWTISEDNNNAVTTKDSLQIWQVALCNSCLKDIFMSTLIAEKKRYRKEIIIYLSILILILLSPVTGGWGRYLPGIVKLMIALVGTFSVIALPFTLYWWIEVLFNQEKLKKSEILNDKTIEKCFWLEGDTIIKSGEKNDRFRFPEFTKYNDLRFTEREKEKMSKTAFCNRKILAVGLTIPVIANKLGADWNKLLNTDK